MAIRKSRTQPRPARLRVPRFLAPVRSFAGDRPWTTRFVLVEAGLLAVAIVLDIVGGPAEHWVFATNYEVVAGLIGAFVLVTFVIGAVAFGLISLSTWRYRRSNLAADRRLFGGR